MSAATLAGGEMRKAISKKSKLKEGRNKLSLLIQIFSTEKVSWGNRFISEVNKHSKASKQEIKYGNSCPKDILHADNHDIYLHFAHTPI